MTKRILLVFGVVYVLIGILGFIPGITQMQPNGQGLLLGIFAVNTLHNITHLLLGAIMLWGATSGPALAIARGMAGVFALLIVASFIAPIVEGVAINLADTGLHAFSFLVMAYAGWMTSGTRSSAAVA
jgi:hypothetical protein